MSDQQPEAPPEKVSRDDLLQQASMKPRGIAGELWDFLSENKKWWLAPPIIALLLLGILMIFGGSTAGPFIYTLF